MKHHFFHYMDRVIQNRWNDVAFADYGEMIMDVVTKEDFKDFFSRVMKLLNR